MRNKEIRDYYKEQIEWYTEQVEWYTEQINWYSKMMKMEKNYHDGFETIQYDVYKKQRAKDYRTRSKDRKQIERYKRLLADFDAKHGKNYEDLKEETVETVEETKVEVEVKETVVENKTEKREYTKFDYTPFYPGSISVVFHNPKNGKYMYTLQTWENCFTFKPQDNKSIENNREVLKFYRTEGFDTFRSVLDYIEKYF